MTNQNSKQNVAISLDDISLTELENKITILKSSDFRGLSIDQLREMIAEIIDQCPLQPRPLRLSGVYRARKNCTTQIFTNASDLWYPPSSVIKTYGRLNNVGQSLFYAAMGAETAFHELRPKIGEVITVLIARTKDDYALMERVPFVGIERSRSEALHHLRDEDIFRTSTKFRQQLGDNNYKKWLLIDDYLSFILGKEVLDSEDYLYKPSVAFANLLFSYPKLDAINYPSVLTQNHGINICMLPEKADFYFKPSEVWMIKVDGEDVHPVTKEKLPRIIFLRRSKHISPEGNIEWMQEGEGLTQEEIRRFIGGTKVENLSEFPKPHS